MKIQKFEKKPLSCFHLRYTEPKFQGSRLNGVVRSEGDTQTHTHTHRHTDRQTDRQTEKANTEDPFFRKKIFFDFRFSFQGAVR